ncbi:ORF039 [Saltwater crocodilepox virus]|nr:hypothetical protein [Saltwater crocodilepox virus]AVD69376.1 hypothetical protein [Saltwater crocodilepox virus]QGT46478.1 ORF039 [Saltwater crocodilepox virus]QGT46694.1 ORF039 [Saltwater crocodilepox virus]QGT46911.1 ORF039 [Saltwater crocodilepox virus]
MSRFDKNIIMSDREIIAIRQRDNHPTLEEINKYGFPLNIPVKDKVIIMTSGRDSESRRHHGRERSL